MRSVCSSAGPSPAGQSRGIVYGALVGFVNGMLTLFLFGRFKESGLSVLVFAEPVMHLAIGRAGRGTGMLIWRPAHGIPELEGSPTTTPSRPGFDDALARLFIGPIHMGRVCSGALVVIAGVVWSNAILEFLMPPARGPFDNLASASQAGSSEISALAVLIGTPSPAPPPSTGSSKVSLSVCAQRRHSRPATEQPKIVFETIVFTVSGIVILTLVGGWFGSQLLPAAGPALSPPPVFVLSLVSSH